MAPTSPAAFWLRRARLVATCVNAAWFWQRLLPALVTLNLLLAAWLLIARQTGGSTAKALWPYLAALALCAGVAALRGRTRRYTRMDGLLRIETALGLHNRLSCAAAGVTDWPPPPATGFRVLHLRPLPVVLPVLYSALFILAALWLPVRTTQAGGVAGEMVEPAAWTQVADWAELLREEQLVTEETVAKLEERLDQLRERPQEDWYQQGSLEAGETLRDQTLLAMQELARQLQATAALMENLPLQENAGAMNALLAGQLEEQWQKQLEQLQNSPFTPDPQTMAQLQQMCFAQMNSISPDQLQAMQEQMAQAAQRVGGAAGLSELDLEAVSMQALQAANGEAERGPGAAPLLMSDEGTALRTTKLDGVSNLDMRNPVLGQTVGTATRPAEEPQEQDFKTGVLSEGAASEGDGAKALWQETYTPQERSVLENYFK